MPISAYPDKFGYYRVTGDTYPRRSELNAAGGVYDKPSKSWTVPVGNLNKIPGVILYHKALVESHCHMAQGFEWVTDIDIQKGTANVSCPLCDSPYRDGRRAKILGLVGLIGPVGEPNSTDIPK